MAYNITLTDGTSLVTLNDGTTDTTHTDLTLIGKNFAGYGQFLNENFVALLENFSADSVHAPATPLQGQLWWNKTSISLQVWTGTQWKGISSTAAQSTAPANPNDGDLWWDTGNQQLKVWNNSSPTFLNTWTVIGPQYSSGTGLTGAIATVVYDTPGSNPHIVIELVTNNVVTGIISADSVFSITTPFAATISPGYNLSTVPPVVGQPYQFVGNCTNANNLGGLTPSSYLLKSGGTMTGKLVINNSTGLAISNPLSAPSVDFAVNPGAPGANVLVTGGVLGKNMNFSVNYGGVSTTELVLDATLGVATVPNITASSPGSSITNKYYVDNHVTTGGNVVSTNSVSITTLSTISPTAIAGVSQTVYRSAEFLIQATDTVANKYQASKVIAMHDGTNTFSTEYGLIVSGNVIATYSTLLASGNLTLSATPATSNSTTFKVTIVSTTL